MFSMTAQDLIADLSGILFHAMWLGVVIGLALLGLQRFTRQKPASLRYGIDVTGLWLLLCLPVFTWFLLPNHSAGQSITVLMNSQPIPGGASANVELSDMTKLPVLYSDWQNGKPESSNDLQSSTANTDRSARGQNGQFVSAEQANGQLSSTFLIPPNIVVMAWGLGVVLFSLRLIVGYIWVLKISASRSAINPELLTRIESRYQNQKWRIAPRVFVSSKLSEAIVVGYLRPLVLVPLSWTTQMAPETLEAVIVHELTHIRRFDLWVILLQRVAETLLFFHPVVWWISKRISIERELCCDVESVCLLDSNVAYAEALEEVATYLFKQSQSQSQQPGWLACILSPNFGGQKMELLTRIQQTLQLPSHNRNSKVRRTRHGMTMLMIPVVLLGTGLALVQTCAEDPLQSGIIIEVPTEKSLPEEAGKIRHPRRLFFGAGVKSDAGLLGQIILHDFNFQNLGNDHPDKQKNRVLIQREDFILSAEKIEVDSKSNKVWLSEGELKIRNDAGWVTLQADCIELQFIDVPDLLSKVPRMIRATGNVKYTTSQKKPKGETAWVTGCDLEWNLTGDKMILQGTNLFIESMDTVVESTPLTEAETNARTPPDWTKLHNQALNEIAEFDYAGSSLEDALVAIGKEHFRNRLVIDRQELRKSGISLNSEVDCHLSGMTLRSCLKLFLQINGVSYYFENGNIVVSSKLKVTHHRVSQKHHVAQILEHEEFFLGSETIYDPVGKVEQLIDFLKQEPSSPDWQAGWEKSSIDFDPETQRLMVLAPQSHQVKIQQRIDLLNQFIQQKRGGLFPYRFRKVVSAINKQENCIDKFLLTYKEQQRVKIAREEIPQKLQQKISVNFENEKFSTLLKFVSDHAGINIVVDEAALAEVGIRSDEPISVHLEDVAATTVLEVVLQSYGLKSVIEDEVLKITSSERAEGELLVMVYSLSDLISDSESPELELARIGELIQSVIAPDRWDDVGGFGSLVSHELTTSLVIRQTRSVHDEIEWLLHEIQNVRLGNEPEKLPEEVPKYAATVEKLEKLISLDINEESLSKTLEEWKQQLGIQIYIDQQGLLEAGVTLDTKVFLKFHGTTQQLFNSLGLGYQVHDQLIVVTSKQRSAEPLKVQLYSTRSKHFERRGLKAVCREMKSRYEPASWDISGGAGVATFDGESETLVIRQSDEVHKRISEYLK